MPVPSQEQQASYFAPKNTAEKVGKVAEQAGEFMVPGGSGGGSSNQTRIDKAAPKLGKGCGSSGSHRNLGGVLGSGQQGAGVETSSTGAALGAGGQAIGRGLKAAAPIVAKKLLSAFRRQHAHSARLQVPRSSMRQEVFGLKLLPGVCTGTIE